MLKREKQHGSFYLIVTNSFVLFVSGFQLWFWAGHFKPGNTGVGQCQRFGFIFGRVNLDKGFPHFQHHILINSSALVCLLSRISYVPSLSTTVPVQVQIPGVRCVDEHNHHIHKVCQDRGTMVSKAYKRQSFAKNLGGRYQSILPGLGQNDNSVRPHNHHNKCHRAEHILE